MHYRFKKLNQDYLKELIEQTAKQTIEKLKAKELYCLIADGKGFWYAQTDNLPSSDMLAKLGIKAKYFLGDAHEGKSAEMLKLVKEKGMSADSSSERYDTHEGKKRLHNLILLRVFCCVCMPSGGCCLLEACFASFCGFLNKL